MNHDPTAEQRRYWTKVAALGCMICCAPSVIAHAHGGSIVERMQEPKSKGLKIRRYHWLVLNLCPFHHIEGPEGEALDRNVPLWEANNGSQADHIDRLAARFKLNLWVLASSRKQSLPAYGSLIGR